MGFATLGLSYAITDVLLLRLCLAVASVILVLWGALALQGEARVSVVLWNSLFCLVNVFRGRQVYVERRGGGSRRDKVVESGPPEESMRTLDT